MNNRKQLAIVLFALVALVIPTFAPAFRAQAQGKSIVYYNSGEPATIDPQAASYVDQVAFDLAIFRGLLKYDLKGNVVASIADVPSVENGGISKDGKTYTFKLKPWKWSDGKELVAGDFVYSLDRLVDPKLAASYGYLFNGVIVNATEVQDGKKKPEELGVKATDDKTLVISLVQPTGYLNNLMAMWASYAVRKDNVERAGDPGTGAWTDPANGPVIGSGPYNITAWDHNKEIVLEKNPNFSGTPAKIDKITFPLIDDTAVVYAGYKAGEIDLAAFPTAEYDNIKADPVLGKELLQYDNTCVTYLAFDNTKKPFSDKKVRQAFSYAIDRETYSKVISRGLSKPYYSFLPSVIPGNDPEAGKEYTFNLDKAKALMKEAGYPDGKGFPSIAYNYVAGATGQRRADWYQAQLKDKLNVDLTMNPMDGAVYQAATNEPINKLSGLTQAGWCMDYPHASDYLPLVLGSGGAKGNSLNIPGYKSAAFDKLNDQAALEPDPAKQQALYQKAQQQLIDDQPVAFLNIGLSVLLVKPRIDGIRALASVLDSGTPASYDWESLDVK